MSYMDEIDTLFKWDHSEDTSCINLWPDALETSMDVAGRSTIQEPSVDHATPPETPAIQSFESLYSGGLSSGQCGQQLSSGSHNGSFRYAERPIGITGVPMVVSVSNRPAVPFHVDEPTHRGPPVQCHPRKQTTVNREAKGAISNMLYGKEHSGDIDGPPPVMTSEMDVTTAKVPDEELMREKLKLSGRIHAAKTRQKRKEMMAALQQQCSRMEVITEIYKKCLSIFHDKLYGNYPNFTTHKMIWYKTADGKDGYNEVNCLLPNIDEWFLQELGNNPGNGHLPYPESKGATGEQTGVNLPQSKPPPETQMKKETNVVSDANIPVFVELLPNCGQSELFPTHHATPIPTSKIPPRIAPHPGSRNSNLFIQEPDCHNQPGNCYRKVLVLDKQRHWPVSQLLTLHNNIQMDDAGPSHNNQITQPLSHGVNDTVTANQGAAQNPPHTTGTSPGFTGQNMTTLDIPSMGHIGGTQNMPTLNMPPVGHSRGTQNMPICHL